MQTATLTIQSLTGIAAVAQVGGNVLFLKTVALGSDGLSSGVPVRLASSDTGIAKVTTAEQDGAAPAGVIGVSPGTVTITATASDNTAVTATLAVTVS